MPRAIEVSGTIDAGLSGRTPPVASTSAAAAHEDRDAPTPCEVCGARVHELRRGRCWGCYQRWAELRPVGLNATCVLCGERRRDCLRRVELLGAWRVLCHDCAARAARVDPPAPSIPVLRILLSRERRLGDRRTGRRDPRPLAVERRGLERREVGHAVGADLLLLDDTIEIEIDVVLDDPDDALAPVEGAAAVPGAAPARRVAPPGTTPR